MKVKLIIFATLISSLFYFSACQETPVESASSKNFTLIGEVINEDTQIPIEGAFVSLNPSLSSTLSDSAGKFTFTDISLAVESYTLNVESDNYRRYVQAIATSTLPEEVSLIVPLEPLSTDQNAPTRPSNPSPAHEATGVGVDVTFSWSSTDDTPDQLRFDVFLIDATGSITVAENLISPEYELEGLSFGESYAWQIAAYDGVQDTIYSPIWQFTTSSVPGYSLAFDRTESNNLQVYTGDIGVADEDLYLVTRNGGQSFKPKFSPDGANIAYLELTGVDAFLMLANADGSNAIRIFSNPINPVNLNLYDFDWTANGASIVFGFLNEVRQVDVSTRRVSRLKVFQSTESVQEVSASPNDGIFAVNLAGDGGQSTTIVSFSVTSTAIDTIMPDTIGIVSGIEYSPSGNQILMSIDQSGQESQTLRQLDAQIFEFDLGTNHRFNLSESKPAGLNDFAPSYSVDGAFIYFTRGSNRLDREPAIWRVPRLSTNAELVIDRGRNPTLR